MAFTGPTGAWKKDIRFAIRAARRRPLPSLLAILTIALGIGVSTSIFSIVNAILLKPPPYKDPDRLVMLWNLNEREGYTYDETKSRGVSMSPAEFLEWKNESGIFDNMAAFVANLVAINDPDNPEMAHGYMLTEGGFRMLGVDPAVGRLPTPEEEKHGRRATGAAAVRVLAAPLPLRPQRHRQNDSLQRQGFSDYRRVCRPNSSSSTASRTFFAPMPSARVSPSCAPSAGCA